jgi:hypothetical protein
MIKCNNVQEQAQDLSALIFQRWQELLVTGDFVLGEESRSSKHGCPSAVTGPMPFPSIQAPTLCFWRCGLSE